ncbi:class I SAM-dependent methyltransferase [bacterium]|nr:class I SAM-dependent methyltransferase [bacterium]
MTATVHGNYYDKYGSKNPVARWLTSGFKRSWAELLNLSMENELSKSILEVGCGDGQLLDWSRETLNFQGLTVGLEPGYEVLQTGKSRFIHLLLITGSIYDLPFPDNSFDLITVPEVFEHLKYPQKALTEVCRVSRRYVLASVPWEPVWRLANLVRGSYWSYLGNTPGHIQHFSRKGFIRFIQSRTEIVEIQQPFPWTMILAEVRR